MRRLAGWCVLGMFATAVVTFLVLHWRRLF